MIKSGIDHQTRLPAIRTKTREQSMNTIQIESQTFAEMPVELQETILHEARKLPKGPSRADFVRSLTRRTGKLLGHYRCTVSYGLIGMVLGEVIDQALSFALPEHMLIPKGMRGKMIEPTLGLMDKVLAVTVGWMGWKNDRRRNGQVSSVRQALREFEGDFRRIIREELEKFFPDLIPVNVQPA